MISALEIWKSQASASKKAPCGQETCAFFSFGSHESTAKHETSGRAVRWHGCLGFLGSVVFLKPKGTSKRPEANDLKYPRQAKKKASTCSKLRVKSFKKKFSNWKQLTCNATNVWSITITSTVNTVLVWLSLSVSHYLRWLLLLHKILHTHTHSTLAPLSLWDSESFLQVSKPPNTRKPWVK